MNRPMAALRVLWGLALATAAATPYAADSGGTLRVAGGTPSGEYIRFAGATCEALGSLFSCRPVVTAGSQDNVERLKLSLTDPQAVDAAFIQGDVADRLQQETGFHDHFVVVRNLAGEAVFLVMTPETVTAVGNWVGIKDHAFLLTMGLPGEKSGDTATFKGLRAITGSPLQALDDQHVKQYAGRPQLLAAVQAGEVRIGWLVQYPNPDNDVFKKIAAMGLVAMGVVDPDFVQLSGSFREQDVTVAKPWYWRATVIHTTVLKTAIVARASPTYPDARSRDIQNLAIHAMQKAREADLLPQRSRLRTLSDSVIETIAAVMRGVYNTIVGSAVGDK